MASHEYYETPYHKTPYHDPLYDGRNEAPLPPLPSNAPLDEYAYPYQNQAPAMSYPGSSGRLHDDPDPYEDEHAVQMSSRKNKHDSTATVTPILPHQMEDPFVIDTDPRKQRRRKSTPRQGWFKGRVTWVVYILTVVELIVFIAELVKNGILTKSPIETHPSFNPMIGPSPYVLINMGARYQPCMHNMPNVQNATGKISWPCPDATSTSGNDVSCTLSQLCGFSGVPNPHVGGSIHDQPAPNQWWRFIVPIFLHAGIIHIAFNLLLQLTLGRDIELLIGSVRFAIVYFAAGIFGFVLGGNFAANGIASCGCSGSLFGILAINLLDLLYTWKQRPGPVKDLMFILVDVLIAFVLGLLPGLDSFSHIGGFLMGLVLGVCILHSPSAFSARRASVQPTTTRYSGLSAMHHHHHNDSNPSMDLNTSTAPRSDEGLPAFLKHPLSFFQDRRPHWWAWWLVRAAALVGCLIGFILLLDNFYKQPMQGCRWCKYLSCLPVKVGNTNWCDVGNLDFTPNNGTSGRRDLYGMALGRASEGLW
ncbi:hypothetical protein LTR91_010133 [Friedmanniomyces endolithicus]|uniref:Rhomboid-type serine protease n=1 Tax=Friedmanniomyces endolithicus TaxID=329885 RepID=A0AAN6KK23_9PEZI|nr:hypothetical protein LTR94_020259 [Friedmanniomyces endolithicus]KAK0768952.1 hypothetical protein LTR59_017319 [Friedmanniomyces endolithicus]KAK0769983.1 hypothetical protein LTR38_017723 [Friedmanniomyces endolithicus]KAK0790130.1 hypothetical protein LTR75_012151 [Friedmanniomyces endolithicus]KAK0854417.1 hypothetical protein LTR03_002448 [Friedmanniomyces endolithicus]